MKNKKTAINLFFSAFLILAYVICSYFFSTLTTTSAMVSSIINALIFVVFGLLLFYATRVGDGKQVKRFSLIVLILLDLPCLYVILAGLISALPLHDLLSAAPAMIFVAGVALGYGIPYTFLSGYELDTDTTSDNAETEATDDEEEEYVPLTGGLEEELTAGEIDNEYQKNLLLQKKN